MCVFHINCYYHDSSATPCSSLLHSLAQQLGATELFVMIRGIQTYTCRSVPTAPLIPPLPKVRENPVGRPRTATPKHKNPFFYIRPSDFLLLLFLRTHRWIFGSTTRRTRGSSLLAKKAFCSTSHNGKRSRIRRKHWMLWWMR